MARGSRGRSGGKSFQLKLLPAQLGYLQAFLQSLRSTGVKGPIVTLLEKLERVSGRETTIGYHQIMLTAGEARALNDWYGRIQEEKIPAKVKATSSDISKYEDISKDYDNLLPDEKIILVPVREFVEDLIETRVPEFERNHYLLDSLLENTPMQIVSK